MSITAHDICTLIAQRHGVNQGRLGFEWALFFELANGTGASAKQQRFVDAFAFNLWPSKGHHRVAYEIKISRSDFLHELSQPDKRQWGWDISNEFWFACAPGVAAPDEVPEGCGLLEVRGDKLVRKKAAQQRQARDLTINEIASFARQCSPHEVFSTLRWRYAGKVMDTAQLDELIAAERGRADLDEIERRAQKRVEESLNGVRESMKSYAEALREAGVEPPPWMAVGTDVMRLGRRGLGSSWEATSWVHEHVHPGPNLCDVQKAISSAEKAVRNAETALQSLQVLVARKVENEE